MYIHVFSLSLSLYIYIYICIHTYVYIQNIHTHVVLVRIRRLRKSLQYSLVILQGELSVSTNLRKTSARDARRNGKIPAREIP